MNRALLLLLVAGCEIGPAIYIERSGDGEGEVTSDPDGLHCGDDCAMIVDDGTITLTATPGARSQFAGWSIDACASTEPCTLELTADTHVTARFELASHSLTVMRSGSGTGLVRGPGIDCGDRCESSLRDGTEVTLTATPESGSRFVRWSGACEGMQSSCTLRVDRAANVVAEFGRVVGLAVARTGDGRVTANVPGIDCGFDCVHSFAAGTIVTLAATPAAGWMFAGWDGPCTGTSPTCVVTLDQTTTVTASFVQLVTLSIQLAGTGSSSVRSEPTGINCTPTCTAGFPPGASVTLTAVPAPGSMFVGWSGACAGTGPCTVTMDAAKDVHAESMKIGTLTVTRFGTGSGTVTSSDGIDCGGLCSKTYPAGTVVTLTAQPAPGSTFVGWVTGCISTAPSCTVTISGTTAVTAKFDVPPSPSCTAFVTQSENAATFNTRLTTPNSMICLGDGVMINGEVKLGADNITITATPTLLIRFTSAGTAIHTSGHTGIRLTDLQIGGTVYVDNNSSLYVARSSITSSGTAIYASGTASVEVVDSLMEGGSEAAMTTFFGASLDMRNSTVRAREFAIIIGGPGAPSTVRLDGNRFRKVATTSTTKSPLHSNRTDNVVLSTIANSFCNEGTSTTDGEFTLPLIAGFVTPTWSFYNVAHTFQGNCP